MYRCRICEWVASDPRSHISGCLMTWHVFEKHPDVWREKFGDRPPRDPDVRTEEGMITAMMEMMLDGL